MTNQEISKIFHEMALLYEMQGDRFRSRAYENGAEEIEAISEDLKDIYKKGGVSALEHLSGIGRGMAEKIEEFLQSGTIKEYQTMKRAMPVDLEELTAVEGLGPKGVKTLYQKLGIKSLKDLEKAVRAGKIRELEGFGEKSEQNILEGIEFVKKSSGRMPLGKVWPRAQALVEELNEIDGVERVSLGGSLRRRKETVGDIDILVAIADSSRVSEIMDHFTKLPGVEKVLGKGAMKASIRLSEGFDMDLRIVPQESWGAALQSFTGSKAHNIKLRQIAIDKGFKLNDYGLFKGREKIAGATEEEVYKVLGFACPEPELREDTGEIEILSGIPFRHPFGSLRTSLPKIINYGSLKGDLQVQTNWTDGDHSIEEMALAAKAAGLKYIVITDHTKSLAMTGGCDEKKLLRQMAEIDALNQRMQGIKILKGAEVNIMKDGSLDINDETLAKLDVAGVSVHSLFKMSKRDMTERIIRAIRNPHVDILFHPTGRLINRRPPYEIDIEEVIKEAVKTGTILEINASPARLDLKDEHIRIAVELGAKFAINSDAHAKDGFKYLEFGIAQARRGWATADDIVNTLPVGDFLDKLK